MRTLWSIFWSRKADVTVSVLLTLAVLLLLVDFAVLAAVYAVTGVAINFAFGSSAGRGSS